MKSFAGNTGSEGGATRRGQMPLLKQTLYSLNVNNAARGKPQTLTPVLVTKIGRKYFDCTPQDKESHFSISYHLEDWREKTDYSPDTVLYASPQEWEEEKETKELCWFINRTFEHGLNLKKTSLENLRKIRALIEQGSGA